jgi:hypothetical protein
MIMGWPVPLTEVAEEQFLVQLLSRPQADELDIDGILTIASPYRPRVR